MLTWMRVLWPSFLVAGIAGTVFFTFFDPMDLSLFGERIALSRMAVYSLGFFMLWIFAAASSGLTCFLQRSADDLNRCPLEGAERPAGCPKREEPDERTEA
ncbi:MAG: hypothetical protein HY661_06345 [Betaproteobacteria bacterium]|nr:hypothetical protein [Betaproteobacteria bacterium]